MPHPRRIILFDMCLLVATAGFASWLVRTYIDMGGQDRSAPYLSPFAYRLRTYSDIVFILLRSLILGLLILRFYPPRPVLRRLTRQPGFAIMIALTFMIGYGFLQTLFEELGYGWLRPDPLWCKPGLYPLWYKPGLFYVSHTLVHGAEDQRGIAPSLVLVTLLSMMQRGCWIKADWIEYASRVVGILYVTHSIAFWLADFFI